MPQAKHAFVVEMWEADPNDCRWFVYCEYVWAANEEEARGRAWKQRDIQRPTGWGLRSFGHIVQAD